MFTRGLCTRRTGMYKSVYNCTRAGTQTIIIISRFNKLPPHFRFFFLALFSGQGPFGIVFFYFLEISQESVIFLSKHLKKYIDTIFFVNVSLHVYFKVTVSAISIVIIVGRTK